MQEPTPEDDELMAAQLRLEAPEVYRAWKRLNDPTDIHPNDWRPMLKVILNANIDPDHRGHLIQTHVRRRHADRTKRIRENIDRAMARWK